MWTSTAYPLENLEILIITPKKTYYTSKPNLTAEEKYKETMTLVYTDKNIKKTLGEIC
jgi:hypothetical protein